MRMRKFSCKSPEDPPQLTVIAALPRVGDTPSDRNLGYRIASRVQLQDIDRFMTST